MVKIFKLVEKNGTVNYIGADALSQEYLNRYPERLTEDENMYSLGTVYVKCLFTLEEADNIDDYTDKCIFKDIINLMGENPEKCFDGVIELIQVLHGAEVFSVAMDVVSENESEVITISDMYSSNPECLDVTFSCEDNTIWCNMFMLEESEDSDYFYNREYKFDVFGSEMLPLNHFVLVDEVIDFIYDLSTRTNHKYTFHQYGVPTILVDKEGIKKMSWAC